MAGKKRPQKPWKIPYKVIVVGPHEGRFGRSEIGWSTHCGTCEGDGQLRIHCLTSLTAEGQRRSTQVIRKRYRVVVKRVQQRRVKNAPILSSFDISSLPIGVTCVNGVCHHYGTNIFSTSQGSTIRWIAYANNAKYFCYNRDVRECPQLAGAKYRKYLGKQQPDRSKLKRFELVSCGKVYICLATNKRACPDVPVVVSGWKEVKTEVVYTKQDRGLIIVCVASIIEECYKKHGRDNWDTNNDVQDYSGVIWYIIHDGVKYYCRVKKREECPPIKGIQNVTWRRYCNGTIVEECDKHLWRLTIHKVVIFCEAIDVEDCKNQKSGDWVPSDKDKTDYGTPKGVKWVATIGDIKVYCDADNDDACPKLEGSGFKWEQLPDKTGYEEGNLWEKTIKGITIVCKAKNINNCKKIMSGKWKPSDRGEDDEGVPDDAVWVKIIGKVKVYCDAKLAKSCPKLKKGSKKWKPVDELPEEVDKEGNGWELTINGKRIVCKAKRIKDCKKIHPGEWKPSDRGEDDEGVPVDVVWGIIIGKVKIYCDAKSAKSCPTIGGGGNKWKPADKLPKEDNEEGNGWELTIDGKTIVCKAKRIKDCKKIHPGEWKPSDRGEDDEGVPVDVVWGIIIGKVKIYCDAKTAKSCPTIGGGGNKWKPADKLPKEVNEEGNGWELTVDGKTIVCKAKRIKDCKKIHPGEWKPSDRGEDDEGVPVDVVWGIIIGKVKIYCDAKTAKSCPTIGGGGNKWKPADKLPKEVNEEGNGWELTINGKTIVCKAKRIKDCKKIHPGEWKPSDRGEDDDGVPDGVVWGIIIGKVKIYCDAKSAKSCPTIRGGGNKWKPADKLPEEVNEEGNGWELTIDGKTIVCKAKRIKDCKKIHPGEWKPSDRGEDDEGVPVDVVWGIIIGKVKIYCDAKSAKSCPTIGGGGNKWKPADKLPKEDNEEGNGWELTINGKTIVCKAKRIKDCKKIHPGEWKPSDRGEDDEGVPVDAVWVKIIGKVKIYCDAKTAKSCPTIGGGGNKWKPADKLPEEDNEEGNGWELTIDGNTIVCKAKRIKDCKKIYPGEWKPSDRGEDDEGVPVDAVWVKIIGKVKIYCDEKTAKSCPTIGGGGNKWKPADKLPEEDNEEGNGWELTIDGNTIVCKAKRIKDCKKIYPGEWKPSDRGENDDGVPDGVVWVIIVGKVKIYCDAKDAKSCPKLKKGGSMWEAVEPKKTDDGKPVAWELKIKSEIIICVANDIKLCKKLRKGSWVSSNIQIDDNGVPENGRWMLISHGNKVYCVAKNVKSCPRIKGKSWDSIGGNPGSGEEDNTNNKNAPNDARVVDVAVIVPDLIIGLRFVIDHGDNTVLLCYSKQKRDCPDGMKWNKKTTKDAVGVRLSNVILRINVWVKIIRETHIVCVAEEVKSCKPEGDGWVIIGGTKSSLWMSKSKKNTQMFCDAEDVSSCPDSVGRWVLLSIDQFEQTTLELKKKGEMWRIVTFKSTIYCDSKEMGRCPYIKDYTWHKVFGREIDVKVFEKRINYEATIRNTLYYCKAKVMDSCPPLIEDTEWEKVKEVITVELVLEFFKDIVHFADACRSGVCIMKKKDGPLIDLL